jgi:hypothetical protein
MKKITWANIKATLLNYFYTVFPNQNGWMPVTDTWAYASASTITVPAGASTTYSAYSKVKFTQHGTTKYGYIYPTSDILLTFYAGSDFVIENTATYPITNIYYSNVESPIGFPHVFNFSPTVTPSAGSITTATYTGKFSMSGKFVLLKEILQVTNNGTGSGYIQSSLPIPALEGYRESFSCITITIASGLLIFGDSAYVTGDNMLFVVKAADGAYPVASGQAIILTGQYEAA